MYFSRAWTQLTQFASLVQNVVVDTQTRLALPEIPDFAFSAKWQILGPFQIGTRETPWSSDPLEFYGGFHSLEYNPEAKFKSSLAFNGSVLWLNHTADLTDPDSDYSRIRLHVDFFPVIDWPFLQDVYGWAGHQWMAWARGEINVESEGTKTLILHTGNVMEFWVDDVHYFGGDFYSYKRAPVTLHLTPGVHRIDVKLVGDVRSVGGVGEPTVDIQLDLIESSPGLSLRYYGDDDVLISDVIGGDFGPLVSPYASVIVRNDALHDIYVHGFEGMEDVCEVELISNHPIRLVPGQTRPIAFQIGCVPSYNRRLHLQLKHRLEGEENDRSLYVTTWPAVTRYMDVPHRITYMHPGGIVGWGVLRPPALHAPCGDKATTALPVLLALHGAGVNANDFPLMHMFDPLPDLCAWVLFPQGVTSWSGDDWHNWGMADMEAAIASIPQWIEATEWQGYGVDIDRWLVAGHSNGGQGTWYTLTHRPDKVFAAAALSGYSSIQNYVPYTSWRTADAGKMAIVEASLTSYRHDLLTDNAKGIPTIIQHGSKDDNVPAYHSRLMDQRIHEGDGDSVYFEIPDKPHFWNGVATTQPLREFFEQHLQHPKESNTMKSTVPQDFSIVVADPGGMGSKNGVRVLHLRRPGQIGRIDFTFDTSTDTCTFRTSNVNDFDVSKSLRRCSRVMVDGDEILLPLQTMGTDHMVRKSQTWYSEETRVTDHIDASQRQRHGRQLGQMDSILRSHGIFQVVRYSEDTKQIALQISRNLAQYYAADSEIVNDYNQALKASGNVITVVIGNEVPTSFRNDFPIQLGRAVTIRRDDGVLQKYSPRARHRLAAIFLRPLPDERLELVIWGIDERSAEFAARLVPLMTGSGQPDWVVMDETTSWKGLDGVLALGFFDQYWNVSSNSYFT